MTAHDQHTSAEELTAGKRFWRMDCCDRSRPGEVSKWSQVLAERHGDQHEVIATCAEQSDADDIITSLTRRAVERQGEGLAAEIARLIVIEQGKVNKSRQTNPVEIAKHAHSVGALTMLKRLSRFAARHPTPNSADGAENGREG